MLSPCRHAARAPERAAERGAARRAVRGADAAAAERRLPRPAPEAAVRAARPLPAAVSIPSRTRGALYIRTLAHISTYLHICRVSSEPTAGSVPESELSELLAEFCRVQRAHRQYRTLDRARDKRPEKPYS